MTDFFADNFSNCVVLAVLLLAMFPMLESKVAIPFAMSKLLWGDATLSPVSAFFVAFFGSIIPAAFVILLVRFLKKHTSGFVQEKFLVKFQEKHKDKLEKMRGQQTTFKKCLLLATFVAVPLPLTGVWTGSLIAGLTNLKFWQGFLSVLVGEVISCAVVLMLCLVFENSAFYIFIISLCLIAVCVFVNLLASIFKRKMTMKTEQN